MSRIFVLSAAHQEKRTAREGMTMRWSAILIARESSDSNERRRVRDAVRAFFLTSSPVITRSPHPSNQRTQGPGLPHQRHPDDPIYLGIFWVVLIVGACYLGWRYL